MHRLPLILCAIALIGSACSAVLYFQIGNSKQILEYRLADATARATKLDVDLAKTAEQNGALKARVSALDLELERASSKVALAEEKHVRLERDLGEARTDLANAKVVLSAYEATSRALASEVAALRQDLADSRASHASPEAVQAYKTTIAELEKQLAAARAGAAAPGTVAGSTAVFSSRGGRATVLTVGPQNAFVVLNFGAARGASIGQRLNVSQGSDIVATVLISDVRTNFSVAQVLPDTLRGILQKGDSAILVR